MVEVRRCPECESRERVWRLCVRVGEFVEDTVGRKRRVGAFGGKSDVE